MMSLVSLKAWIARAREFRAMRRIRSEIDEEMQFHIDQETAFNVSRGMTQADARRSALNSFGGVERYRSETRDARGFAGVDALLSDIRLSLRRLRRAPAYTAGVVSTFAIALAASTAIGALVYGVMLRPLPYTDPSRIVRVSVYTPGLNVNGSDQSAGTFVFFSERARSFALYGGSSENKGVAITDGDEPERATAAMITPSVFRILGTVPAAGRLFRDEDANASLDSPVLISYELWMRRFGGRADIEGKTIELNRRPRSILGVLPEGFDYPSRNAVIFYPERVESRTAGLADPYLSVIARLAPGVSVDDAQAEVERLKSQIPERFPELSARAFAESGFRVKVEPLRDAMVAPIRAELTLLAIMVFALLLIAFANTATLTLLRAERVQGEIDVSRALGASSWTVTQRFVVEHVMLCLVGASLALPLAAIAMRNRLGLSQLQIPRLHSVALTPSMILGVVMGAIATGILLGLVAAARVTGGSKDSALSLRSASRATGSRAWKRTQEGLVTVQIALSLSLLLSAGLMTSSFARLSRINPGFKAANASKFSAILPFRAYPTYQRTAAFHLAVVDALRSAPGVTAVGGAMQLPSTLQTLYTHPRVETQRESGEVAQALITANVATPDFFKAMEIPVLQGRSFEPGDLSSPTPGVVLSNALARKLFADADAIGREIRFTNNRKLPSYRVVGVTGDVYGERPTEGALQVMYFPLLNDLPASSKETENRIPFMPAGLHYVVRGSSSVSSLASVFRRAVATVDPRVPIWEVRSLESIVGDSTARLRLTMLLLGIAAACTLMLGAIGLYSLIAYAAAGRSREFAVRLAIGASPRRIMTQVFREGTGVAVAGTGAGLALSFASARVLRDLVYGVSPTDPLMFAAAAAVVLACALLATFMPARRASRIDPVVVLHGD